ncbi:MAG: lytic transglycosylase domain-containing protein [Xanthobacteraceae bacterium]|nr:lytic transglycosylase domain-containing protein [Xanthobacteraceae bacterium]
MAVAMLASGACGTASAEETTAGAIDANPPATESAPPPPEAARLPATPAADAAARQSMCLMIEAAARASSLPLDFFARVIWQESRFQPTAVGPLTRSGERAQGIAQFMPRTADERRLLDPFDPVQALPKSAEFLAELRDRFGNLGLAAAAYNAGPRRVQDWIVGRGAMPSETRAYVAAITGASVEEWRDAGRQAAVAARPAPDCGALMALLTRAPNPFVAGLEQRVKSGAASPWGVQLGAGFSRDVALAMYARAMKRLAGVIGARDPELLGAVLRNRGTRMFYQVRIGADTRVAADTLCGQIRRAGQACLVLRNGPAG